MTAETLAGLAGVILSLLFSYIPGLNTKYASLTSQAKSLIMLGILALITAAVYGMACWGVLTDLTGWTLTCDKAGMIALARIFAVAAAMNVTTYTLSAQTNAVREAKEQRP